MERFISSATNVIDTWNITAGPVGVLCSHSTVEAAQGCANLRNANHDLEVRGLRNFAKRKGAAYNPHKDSQDALNRLQGI